MRLEAIEMVCAHVTQGREPPPHWGGVLGVSVQRANKNAPSNKISKYCSLVRQLGCLEPRRSQAKLTWRENAVKC